MNREPTAEELEAIENGVDLEWLDLYDELEDFTGEEWAE